MSRGIFITGTGTDVGKTYVTALVVKKLRSCGVDAGYYKAALSGADEDNGALIPGDAKYVCDIAGINANPSDCVSYIYKNAYSPHLAALIEGNPVEPEVIRKDFDRSSEKYEYITVEGSGGIICPIRYDKKIMLEDIVKELKLPTLLVADAGLGTINSVVLTVFYMLQHGMRVNGIIFNRFVDGDTIMEDNVKMVEEMTGIKVIAKVHKGDTELDIDADILKGMYEEVQK
ncbi:MAG: dethiobiotin synthase [Clostridiales bacterium]|nr:dethiobiotin synthase [Clostridiales bacterium]